MRPLPKFQYHAPKTLSEALELLDTLDNTKPIIGGTDLVPLLREAACRPSHLIDLNRIEALNYVKEEDGFICIGATATHSQVASSEAMIKAPAVVDSVSRIGSPQVRNRGTIAGNLCNASPAADSAPPLLVHDAEVTVVSSGDTRVIPLPELFAGPKINCLEPNELVTEVRFPEPPASSSSCFMRITRRKAFTLSVVSAAVYVEMEGSTCATARAAFGSVAETPVRVSEVEELLTGRELDDEAISEAGETAKRFVNPITDVRGTAEYRRDMCDVLLRRALKSALGRVR
ncbi:xanthine dehydrogenase family protein subunit M [Candidatus Bathyarchaeota archaeon]|nr:xanthine dehydrogenase family protein subunit M [Candidatus Bathyarchaeota archaeon]